MVFFKLEEFFKSATADKKGIKNRPATSAEYEQVVLNISALADYVLDPVRREFGLPLLISSGYRCPELNKAVGGSARSQHLLGEAADVQIIFDKSLAVGWDNDRFTRWKISKYKELFNLFMKNNNFDQLIWEERTGRLWIHVSYRRDDRNRKQIFYSRDKNRILLV